MYIRICMMFQTVKFVRIMRENLLFSDLILKAGQQNRIPARAPFFDENFAELTLLSKSELKVPKYYYF